ncbi:hypothetical protein DFH27DRAFT_152354 [Peziza echinospora]|nr:hypothetical protein DFH27DRAFT_152354 [Peziza echinospora]
MFQAKSAASRVASGLPQSLQNRVKSATRQAELVLRRKREKAEYLDRKAAFKNQVEFNRAFKVKKMKSRADEMEDKWLGPLAPKRFASEKELSLKNAITQDEFQTPQVAKTDRIKFWNIAPKDRVLILKGSDKHKIGTVLSVNKETNTLVVEGLNMVTVEIPQYMLKADPNNKVTTFSRERPLHYNDVRLVYPLPDPETGIPKDTIVADLEPTAVFYDRATGRRSWKRTIPGTGVYIPWPKTEPADKVEHACDTRMVDVEFSSYTPVLLRAPFAPSIIDELRNKYSQFRTRHDPEYLAMKLQKIKHYEQMNAPIRTPLQELNRKIRLEKKALGPPTLTEDILERIGRVMAMNKPEALEKILSKPATPEA